MSYLGMYILTKLDSWQSFTKGSGWVLMIGIGILVLTLAPLADCQKDYDEKFMDVFTRWVKACRLKTVLITAISLLVFSQLLPTTKQAAFIWIAPQIIENGAVKDTVKNIPELTKLGTDYLKELLKEKVENVK